MSEFVVQTTIKDKLWHKFRPLCCRLKRTQASVLIELIERFVRENTPTVQPRKGRS